MRILHLTRVLFFLLPILFISAIVVFDLIFAFYTTTACILHFLDNDFFKI